MCQDLSGFHVFQDRMDLQDALRSVGWRVDLAVEKLKSDMQSLNTAGKKVSLLPKKKSKKQF